MELVGISHQKERYHQYPWQFSGGMRQRCVMPLLWQQIRIFYLQMNQHGLHPDQLQALSLHLFLLRDLIQAPELVTGNEVGVLLLDYICAGRIEKGTMPKNPVAVKSIVSTPLADAVAEHFIEYQHGLHPGQLQALSLHLFLLRGLIQAPELQRFPGSDSCRL